MKLGLGSYACAWELRAGRTDALGIADCARSLGLGLVQLADNVEFDNLDALRASGMQFEIGMRGLELDRVRHHLGICRHLDSRLLRIVVDSAGFEPPAHEVLAILKQAATIDPAITLAVENHDRFPARVLREIIDTVDSATVGICLDTVNSFGALEGPEHVVETLGPRTVNVHFKDFTIRREPHQMGFRIEGTPAGAGMLHGEWLLNRLRHFGFDGSVILELWPPEDATLDSTIATEQQWRESSVRYLRTLIPE